MSHALPITKAIAMAACTLTIVLLLLTACNQSLPADAAQTVSFMVSGDAQELAAYQELVADFEAQNPIKIELRYVPGQSDFNQRLAADFSAGKPANVILLNYRRYARFALQDGLTPLDDFLAQSILVDIEAFYPQAVEAFTLEGQLWCLPQNIASLVVYYNQDLFTAAGVPLPSVDWSQEEFLAAARALTRDLDGDGKIDQYGVGIAPNVVRLAPFIWQAGGDLVDDPTHPTRLTLDDPASLAAFQWFVDLQIKEKVVPDLAAESAEDSESRFLNGTMGMYFNSRRGVPTYRTITTFAWDVAPMPRGAQAANILHSDGYCLSAATENKQAAWKFIEVANSSHGQTIIAATGRTVPSLITVAEAADFINPSQPPASNRVYLDAIPTLRRLPRVVNWTAIEEIANREIERAFYGQISILEAAEIAREQTQSYFDSINP